MVSVAKNYHLARDAVLSIYLIFSVHLLAWRGVGATNRLEKNFVREDMGKLLTQLCDNRLYVVEGTN